MGEREVLPVVQDTPVIAGVNGTDPTRVMPRFLETLTRAGFAGVINFPSHGIIDGRWRQSLEETGFGYDREVEMIRQASTLGMFTMAYVFTPEEARWMTDAGVDVVVAHIGPHHRWVCRCGILVRQDPRRLRRDRQRHLRRRPRAA